MPFEIVRNDIVNMHVDAIVNTANPQPVIGTGVDSGIHKEAGEKLLKARKEIGCIDFGEAAITPAFDLNAKYVIHAVGPVWQDGKHGEEQLLASCYRRALELAVQNHCESIAFPLISTGNYGFPKNLALQIAVREFSIFLMENEIQIYLVVFGTEALKLSEKLFKSVKSYIDDNYTEEKIFDEYGIGGVSSSDSAGRHTEDLIRNADRVAKKISIFDKNEKIGGPASAGTVSESHVRFDETEKMDDSSSFVALIEGHMKYDEAEKKDSSSSPAILAKGHEKKEGAKGSHSDMLPSIAPAKANDWDSILMDMDAGFSETLLYLIDRSGKKDSEVYKKANVDRKLFSKIRNNRDYRPSKTTALAFAFALELDLEETRDFISRAGFALSHSSKFDVIVEYFLIHNNYAVFELNEVLFTFDQPLIGA